MSVDIHKKIIIILIILTINNFNSNNNNINIKNDFKKTNLKLNMFKNKFNDNPFIKSFLDKINIISHYSSNSRKKNIINICMSINNKYIYPVLISMESALSNCNKKKSLLIYHILCPGDIKDNILLKIKSLMNHYPKNIELIYYNMSDIFIKFKHIHFSQTSYYRLVTPIFINLNRIIYLDGDTLILKDLNEMYQTSFDDNYVLGFLDIQSKDIDDLGIKSEKYINSGVLLLNLEKIRKDKKYYDLINFVSNHSQIYYDQKILNFVLYPFIGKLPYKFGMWNFKNNYEINKYSQKLRQKINITELEEAFENPSLFHLVTCWPKPWFSSSIYQGSESKNCRCLRFHQMWYYYANKTDYYEEIIKFYKFKLL